MKRREIRKAGSKEKKSIPRFLISSSIFFLFFLAACRPAAAPDPALQGTVAAFAGTVTARAGSSGESLSAAETAQAQATQTRAAAMVIQAAATATLDGAAQATAAAASLVHAELPLYGADPAAGSLAWLHPPLSLQVDGYRSGDYANDYPSVIARDFVLAADVTMDTEYGQSGCGFTLRSDGELEASNQYLLLLTRGANGHIVFTTLTEGKPANYRNFYVNRLDPAFQWENGSVNRLAVAARGNILQIYSNYTLIGEVDVSEPPPPAPDLPDPPKRPDPPAPKAVKNLADELAFQAKMDEYKEQLKEYKEMVAEIEKQHAAALQNYLENQPLYEEGFVGFFVFAYSGAAACGFENSWLWLED
ncbi:MAG: hypothetical protein L0Z70_00250 [Chloroflexi bacterium]|nr:hypothetical protein [Chloroflexota bacterium]